MSDSWMRGNLKHTLARALVAPLATAEDAARWAASRARLALFHQRIPAVRFFGERHAGKPLPDRVLAFITHVIPRAPDLLQAERQQRVERLTRTLEGLLCSVGQYQLRVVVNTYKDWHLLDMLPTDLGAAIDQVITHDKGDPMFIEFFAHDFFQAQREQYDWFLFLEDDIVIGDPLFVEKVRLFNAATPAPDAIVVPHRYELAAGRKVYVDYDFDHRAWGGGRTGEDRWVTSRATQFDVASEPALGTVRFAEFTNPHAATFMLNRAQLVRWQQTGRHWHGKVSWIGPLESAATGALYEAFRIYKAHPDQRGFFEVRHFDTKYARLDLATPEAG